MKLIEDGEKFDQMQRTLVGALVESVKAELESQELEPKIVRSLLEGISFSMAVILDGSREAEFQGEVAYPFLTFQDDDDDLVSSGGGSWMHEYVFEIIRGVYGEQAS